MSEAAKEYGCALADLAAEDGIEERLLGEVRAVRALYSEHPEYARLLSSPNVPKQERTALLEQAFSGRVHPCLLRFLKLITERGYAFNTVEFLAEYERLYCERHDILTAYVQSAVSLSEDQARRLQQKLCAVTGKNVELSCTVDPALIGGIRLTVNNTLLEGSVRAKLDQMRASLSTLTI